jgi:hypothetical protein
LGQEVTVILNNPKIAGLQTNSLAIEPCILVIDRLKVVRAVTYVKTPYDVVQNPDGSEDAKWETERHYKNRDETKLADATYTAARAKLREVCHRTDIGFICREADADKLEQAIADAKQLVDEANEGFKHCVVKFRVVCTDLRPDNASGAATIQEVLEENITKLQGALVDFDTRKANTLLNSSKNLVKLFQDPKTRKALEDQRQQARALAKEIRQVLKDFDGSVENARASLPGLQILKRADAGWNF